MLRTSPPARILITNLDSVVWSALSAGPSAVRIEESSVVALKPLLAGRVDVRLSASSAEAAELVSLALELCRASCTGRFEPAECDHLVYFHITSRKGAPDSAGVCPVVFYTLSRLR